MPADQPQAPPPPPRKPPPPPAYGRHTKPRSQPADERRRRLPRRPWTHVEAAAACLATAVAGYGPIRYFETIAPGYVNSVTWPGDPVILGALSILSTLVLARLVMVGSHTPRPRIPLLLLLGACVAALTVSFVRYEPLWSPGSDRAEALEVGLRLLLSGQNPYVGHTSLGNTLSPMVGGMLLAAPIMLAFGSLALQGPIWLVITTGTLTASGGWQAAACALVMLAVSPTIRLELVTRSDGWINAAALVVFGTLSYYSGRWLNQSKWGWAALILAGVLFGMSMAYRFIMAIAFLPLLVVMARRWGPLVTSCWTLAVTTPAATLAITPWLIDPAGYAPISKTSHADSPILPHWSLICAVVTLLVVVILSFRARTLPGVWGVTSVSLFVLLALVAIGQQSVSGYAVVSFNGAWLVFTIAALALPRRIGPTLVRY